MLSLDVPAFDTEEETADYICKKLIEMSIDPNSIYPIGYPEDFACQSENTPLTVDLTLNYTHYENSK